MRTAAVAIAIITAALVTARLYDSETTIALLRWFVQDFA